MSVHSIIAQVTPADSLSKSEMLVNATLDGGLIDNLFVAADIKVAPVTNCLGRFLNEEADGAMAAAGICTTWALHVKEIFNLF
ncbi:hypothetical protein DPMN_034424 [Dreissena polymorpha]|uniref:Uncharacterized protein n=1 Tax=Dreissena polymorpha TaxID=45954 RepID=A0A9D4RM33_DREPO|nr:hypothetical protein DPMN_034424 [Dreissena polymorpha]